ncbi:phospholipase D-like domain-containing protein DpdK [Actinomadura citrea]|uniref:phospholipase D-like domain-containing protein DpdK n=1 Tax=Actinomadura citrea TaxID=46158 RepID=UPI003CE4D435
MSTRLIHRSAASPSRDIAECLEALFLSELLDPGKRLLVASPWMSDFPVLNNRGGKFTALDASWTATFVPFSSILRGMLQRGTSVQIACGPGERETELLSRVDRVASLDGTATRLSLNRLPREHRLFSHEKALIGDTWAVYGSMNLTYSGVTMNGELITVTTNAARVATVATELLDLFV